MASACGNDRGNGDGIGNGGVDGIGSHGDGIVAFASAGGCVGHVVDATAAQAARGLSLLLDEPLHTAPLFVRAAGDALLLAGMQPR